MYFFDLLHDYLKNVSDRVVQFQNAVFMVVKTLKADQKAIALSDFSRQ